MHAGPILSRLETPDVDTSQAVKKTASRPCMK